MAQRPAHETHARQPSGGGSMDLVRIILAILLPPLGVFLRVGIRHAFLAQHPADAASATSRASSTRSGSSPVAERRAAPIGHAKRAAADSFGTGVGLPRFAAAVRVGGSAVLRLFRWPAGPPPAGHPLCVVAGQTMPSSATATGQNVRPDHTDDCRMIVVNIGPPSSSNRGGAARGRRAPSSASTKPASKDANGFPSVVFSRPSSGPQTRALRNHRGRAPRFPLKQHCQGGLSVASRGGAVDMHGRPGGGRCSGPPFRDTRERHRWPRPRASPIPTLPGPDRRGFWTGRRSVMHRRPLDVQSGARRLRGISPRLGWQRSP